MSEQAVKLARRMARDMDDMREEILQAFVAKWGFEPDQCQMVQRGKDWFIVRLDPDTVAKVTRAIIVARMGKLTRWKRFCLRMAGI